MIEANHEITYHNLDSSPALNEDINKRIEKLERYSNDIQHVRVVLDSPHNHKHKGKLFRVVIDISTGTTKGSPIHASHDDASIHIAVRDAFEAAQRQLKAHSERERDHRGERILTQSSKQTTGEKPSI